MPQITPEAVSEHENTGKKFWGGGGGGRACPQTPLNHNQKCCPPTFHYLPTPLNNTLSLPPTMTKHSKDTLGNTSFNWNASSLVPELQSGELWIQQNLKPKIKPAKLTTKMHSIDPSFSLQDIIFGADS